MLLISKTIDRRGEIYNKHISGIVKIKLLLNQNEQNENMCICIYRFPSWSNKPILRIGITVYLSYRILVVFVNGTKKNNQILNMKLNSNTYYLYWINSIMNSLYMEYLAVGLPLVFTKKFPKIYIDKLQKKKKHWN